MLLGVWPFPDLALFGKKIPAKYGGLLPVNS
jgi:hypothetical protein